MWIAALCAALLLSTALKCVIWNHNREQNCSTHIPGNSGSIKLSVVTSGVRHWHMYAVCNFIKTFSAADVVFQRIHE